jgi:hypothetical protein
VAAPASWHYYIARFVLTCALSVERRSQVAASPAVVLASIYALRRLAITYARFPRYALWSIHTTVTISAVIFVSGCLSQSITTAPVSNIKDLLPIRNSHYLSFGHFRYTFAVKSDAGFVAPMTNRGFSHFWKFPCLVLTYSRNLQAGLSTLTTSKHFSSPSRTAAYFSMLLGYSAVFSRLPQTVLWTLFYNVAAALVDVMRGDAGLQ